MFEGGPVELEELVGRELSLFHEHLESASITPASRRPTLPRERGRTPGATRYVLKVERNPYQADSSRAPRWPLMVELDNTPGNMERMREQFPKATRQFFEECKGRGLLTLHADTGTQPDNRQQAERDLQIEQQALEGAGYFDPNDKGDIHRSLREIVARRGQQTFRASLLDGYGSQCLVTSCDAEEALEAAHIIPYHESAQNDPRNGLLLRADIHTLFDLSLLSIHPETLTVEIDDKILDTVYGQLHGRELIFDADHPLRPSNAALCERYEK